jgi:hypothetical protein
MFGVPLLIHTTTVTINPPPVVAMPRRTAGPDIMIPTSWQGPSWQGSSQSTGPPWPGQG